MNRFVTATLGLALACGAATAHADAADKAKHMRSPKDSKEFAMKAADSGLLEVRLAQLAQQKAQSDEVKRLARQIEQDHTRANQELMAVVRDKNVDLPKELDDECRETYEAFNQLEGKDFDNAYLLHQTKVHLKDVGMFRTEARSGTDADIKAWAAKTLPALEKHTAHIRTVAAANGLPMDALAGSGSGQGEARPAGGKVGDRDRDVTGTGAGPEANDARIGSGGNKARNDTRDQDR